MACRLYEFSMVTDGFALVLFLEISCLAFVMLKIKIRAIVGAMIFFGYFLLYMVRYNLNVHIIAMIEIQKKEEEVSVMYRNAKKNEITRMLGLIKWNDAKMGTLFAAYHTGYCICFPIFLSFGDRLGPTWVVGLAGIISGVMSCLIPSASYQNYYLVLGIRMTEGFCAGAMMPNMVQVLRHWVPPIERIHFMWAYCGITTGTLCTFLICAAIHYYSYWTVGFYVSGIMQGLWSITWIFIITDYPRKHPYISEEELSYLINSIGDVFTIKLSNSEAPWRSILKSIPFWMICLLNFGYAWMIIAIATYGPFYYVNIGRYTIYNASLLTALPFLFRLVLGTLLIHTFHYYKHAPRLQQIEHLRKYFIIVSHVIPGSIVVITWILDILPGPIILTIAIAFTAAGMDLTLDLCNELSPTYMNFLNTIIKIIANISGILISLGIGNLTYKFENTPFIWKHIWCFNGLVLFLSGIIFLIWGETKIQPWNFKRNVRPRRRRLASRNRSSLMSNIAEAEDETSLRPSLVS